MVRNRDLSLDLCSLYAACKPRSKLDFLVNLTGFHSLRLNELSTGVMHYQAILIINHRKILINTYGELNVFSVK